MTDAEFETYFRRHWSRAVATATAILADPAEAEDCCQEAFMRVKEHFDPAHAGSQGRMPTEPSWKFLSQRVIWVALDAKKKSGPRTTLVEQEKLEQVGSTKGDPELVLVGKRVRMRVAQYLGTLSPAQRKRFVLRFIEGLTGPEIDEITGSRPKVSGARVRQELKRVRDAIAAGHDPFALRDAREELRGMNEEPVICEVGFSGEEDDIME